MRVETHPLTFSNVVIFIVAKITHYYMRRVAILLNNKLTL